MDSNNGALHFDSDIDNRKYLAKLAQMEAAELQFLQQSLNANAGIIQSYKQLYQVMNNKAGTQGINNLTAAVNNPGIIKGLDAIEERFKRLGTLAAQSTNNASQAISNLNNSANQQASQLNTTLQRVGTSIAAYFSVQALKGFGKELITITSQFEQLKVAYSTILGSRDKANALFADTVELAKTTPFNLVDVATSTKQLLAYGFEAKEVTGTLSKLGDIAAGVSAPLGDIAYLYGALKTQGRAYAQDIRQFTGRGIPIIQELAAQFNTTEANVNKLVEAGKIGFPQVEKAFTALTSEGGKFYNLMDEQSRTIGGQISNLEDSFQILLGTIGEGNAGLIKGGIAGLNALIDNYQNIIDVLKVLILTYGSYQVVIRAQPALIALESAAYHILRGSLIEVNKAQLLASASTALYTAGLTAVIALIYAMTASLDANKAAQESLNDIQVEGVKNAQSQIEKVQSLQRSIGNLNLTEADRLKAVLKVREVTGDRLKQYSDEEILAGKARGAIQKYTDALIQNSKVSAAQKRLQEINEQLIAVDPAAQAGGNYQDRVNEAYNNIPLRERAKLTLFNDNVFFNKSGSKVDGENAVREYRNFLDQQRKAIVKIYGDEIDKTNRDTTDKRTSKEIKQALAFTDLLGKGASANFGSLVKTSSGLADFEAIRDQLKEELKKPFITNSEIETIKSQQSKLQPYLDKFSLKYDNKMENLDNTFFDKRKDIFDKLAKLNEQQAASNKSENEAEVDAVKQKYDDILKAITNYNTEAKRKGQATIDPTKIQGPNGTTFNLVDQKSQAVNDTIAKQDLDKFKTQLDAQKILFADYEKYKLEVGETFANQRYTQDLQGFTSYVSYLESILKNLEGKTDPLSNKVREYVAKELPKAENDATKSQLENFTKLLTSTQSYEQQRVSILEKTTRDAKSLRDKGFEQQAQEIEFNGQQQLEQLDANNVQRIAKIQKFNETVVNLTREQAQNQIQALNDILANSNLPSDQRDQIVDQVNKLKSALSGLGGLNKQYESSLIKQKTQLLAQIKTVQVGSKEWLRIRDAIAEIDGLLKKQTPLSNFANAAGEAAGYLSAAAQATQNLDSTLSEGLQKMADIASLASNAAKSFSSFSSGDILGGITGAIGVIGSLGSIFGGGKAAAEQRQYSNDLQIKQIEAINKLLERQIKLAGDLYGTEQLSAYSAALSDIQSKLIQLDSSLYGKYALTGNKIVDDNFITKINNGENPNNGAFNRFKDQYDELKKAGQVIELGGKSLEQLQELLENGQLDEKTTAIVNSMVALGDQYTETLNLLKSKTIGSTFGEIEDDIVSLFENGTIAAEDFANNFEKLMKKSILNSFKRNALDKQLQSFYDQFATFTDKDSGYALTDKEIEALRASYNQIISNAKDQFAAIEKATGIDFSGLDNQQSISGSISRSITESTANTLEGIWRGQYELTKQLVSKSGEISASLNVQIDLMNKNYAIQLEIRDNTLKTANLAFTMNDYLKTIAGNIGSVSGNLKANGR